MSLGAYRRNSRKARKSRRKSGMKPYPPDSSKYYRRRVDRWAGVAKDRPPAREARQALMEYATHRLGYTGPDVLRRMQARAHLVYVGWTPDFGFDGETFRFSIVPRGGRNWTHHHPEPQPPFTAVVRGVVDWPLREKYDRTTLSAHGTHNHVVKVIDTPPGVIRDIPRRFDLAYRGMSWEEFQHIQRTGYVLSDGSFNMAHQGEYLTFFSKDPMTARGYAESAGPWFNDPSFTRPGVVIAVHRKALHEYYGPVTASEQYIEDMRKRIRANPHVNEMVGRGPVSASNIVGAWYVQPIAMRSGFLDVRKHVVPVWAYHEGFHNNDRMRYHATDLYTGEKLWTVRWDDGNRNGMKAKFVIIPVPEYDSGLAGLRR